MSQEITVEQALANVILVCDKFFVGRKEEHVVLDKSIDIIKKALEDKKEQK
jgi:hypothetical protein